MAGNWRKQVSKAAILGDRGHVLKLLQESAEPETVRNLCVPLFGRHKYHKKWKYPVTIEDVVVEGSMSLLDIAAANGWVDVCEELVTKHGCTHETSTVTEILDPDSMEGYKYLQRSPLSYAVKEGHVDVVAYLERAFKLQISDDNEGRAFLTFGIINSQLEMVKYFVSICEIDATKLSGLEGMILLGDVETDTVSPFIIACIQCCDDIIKYLVTEGHCDPREECNWICGRYKISPVIAVAFKGKVELIKYIMLYICSVYFFERDYWSAVPITCVLGDSEVIRFLIRHANIDNLKQSDAKQLLMMSSVCSGLIDCVQYLEGNVVSKGSFNDMYEIRYVNGAAGNGRFDVVKYLNEECAEERKLVSPFTIYAAASSGHLPLIEYLMEEYSDLFAYFGHHDLQRVVLQVAAGCGHLNIVKHLIAKYNLSFNESDEFIQETKFLSLKAITTRNRIESSDGGILHIAAERGHLNIVEYLIDKCDYDPTQTNRYSQTPLHFAAFDGHLPVVEYLLSTCSRVPPDDDGNTPLHFACWQGHLKIIKRLFELCKLDPTTTNRLSQSPIFLALRRGHLPVVEYLADKVPSVGPEAPMDNKGNTVLHLAACSGHINMVKYVIENWITNPAVTNERSHTPLHVAFSVGYMHVAEYLIKEFPGIFTCTDTSVDRRGNTALHIAVQHGSLSTIKYLINHCKLNPYKNNMSLQTPLYLAVCDGNLPVVKYLFSECPSVIPKAPVDDKGNTALHIAAEHGSLSIITYLINECQLNPYKNNIYSQTPVSCAIRDGHLSVVKCLFSQCSTVLPEAFVDDEGNTALHIAAKHGSFSVIKYIINDCKLSPNKRNLNSLTPLHLACCFGRMHIAEYLIKEFPGIVTCTDASVDEWGNTALHIAVQHGSWSIIRYLINDCKLNPNKTNLNSLTPLHVAFSFGKMRVAEYLIKEFPGMFTCTDTSVDKRKNTALHIAIEHGSLSTVQYLIDDCKLNPNKTNLQSLTPLHVACSFGKMPIAEYLINVFPGVVTCTDTSVDERGNTALHIAIEHGSLRTIKHLIKECKVNPNRTNLKSLTPFHVAFSFGRMHIAEYLIKEFPGVVTCTDTSVDEWGNTALHIAVEHGSLITIKHLINQCKLNPYRNNFSFQTPLYLAVYNGHIPVVKCMFSECPVVIPEKPVDNKGNTALHVAAEHGRINVVTYFTKECKLDPNQPNWYKNTSLHLAVTHNHFPVVRYFFDERLCHASTLNYHKCLRSANRETSRVLITEYDVKSSLSSFGSRSTFEQNDKFLSGIKSSFPVHSFTKVLLLGDPAAGKSTLAKNFRDLASSFIPPFFGQVSGVESHTAGIIPVTIQSRQLGNVVLYDLAGQPEFYSSHMAVLHKLMQEIPAVFICVIDLSKLDGDILKELRFWFNFIKMGSATDNVREDSQVVVAGSHADLLSSDVYSQKQHLVERESRKFLVQSFAGLAALDCRKVASTGLSSLIRLFLQAQETIRKKVCNAKVGIPIFCHMLMAFLHKLKERDDKSSVYSLTYLSQMILKENQWINREGILVSIPSDRTELHNFLSILNDRGLVLYIRGSTDEDSWIVVNEKALLSKVIGILFAPEGFKEHHCIASSTGIATSSHITGLFPNIPPQVIIGMLVSLEFCKEIDPSLLRISNLTLEHSQGEFILRKGEKLLFFPSHIRTERPNKVWKIFQFCWYLICQDHHQFSMQFLHVLLLRLAYSFTKHCRVSWQIDQDLCTVWKNGIRWVNKNGIETVVEVLEHCTIVQMVITCPSESLMLEHCHHRSTLIREILALKQELCPSIELQEKFVLPSCLQDLKYPLPPHSELPLLNIKAVAQCAVECIECILFTSSFDPYQNLGESLIRSLFTKGEDEVSERDLFDTAAAFSHNFQTHKNGCKVLEIPPQELENRLSELRHRERNNPVRVCEELFLKWKAHAADGGTYESLKCRFDMFSVFASRNPLDLAEIEQPSVPVPLCESLQNSQSCKR